MIDAAQLQAKELSADASGAAEVYADAYGKLEINASGASSVIYSGNPETVSQNVTGSATIESN